MYKHSPCFRNSQLGDSIIPHSTLLHSRAAVIFALTAGTPEWEITKKCSAHTSLTKTISTGFKISLLSDIGIENSGSTDVTKMPV